MRQQPIRIGLVLVIAGYLATGLFVVPGNEKAVVRRFGRAILPARPSGLHYDWPWPFAQIDRVNFNEVRTLTLGDVETDTNFLRPTSAARPLLFLTGDKNLLLLRITVQYRISEAHVKDWLYASQSPISRLQSLVETTAAELVSRSGVDFVHTLGLASLNYRLFNEVRQQVESLRLGCEIEQVTVDRAEPAARVKSEFLDVSNARADMARSIHDARSYAEQKAAEARADASKIKDTADRESRVKVSTAQGAADRFETIVQQIHADAQTSDRTYEASRQMVMSRLTLETLRDALQKAKLKVVLDGDKPFDLTIPK